MDFNDTEEENNFRLEVRGWLEKNAPQDKKIGGYDPIDVEESGKSLGVIIIHICVSHVNWNFLLNFESSILEFNCEIFIFHFVSPKKNHSRFVQSHCQI